jgi:SAM-dependent MidA family methyltransferase
VSEPTPVEIEVAARIHRRGPIPFDEVVDLALYHPDHGFYSGSGRAGRGGDFLTSPEVGPLFGAVLAKALDAWWLELGSPDRFTVVEAAAGTGTMARAVLAASPACAPALTYVLVERAASLRRRHVDQLPLVDPILAFEAEPDDDAVEPRDGRDAFASNALEGPARRRGDQGPRVVSLPDLPAIPIVGVVLANELLDNLGFGLLERGETGWFEVRVGRAEPSGADADPSSAPGVSAPATASDGAGSVGLSEVLVPATERDARLADRLVPDAAVGARIPMQHQASEWLTSALSRVDRGRVVVIDYGRATAAMAERPQGEWLRTYRDHTRGGAPLEQLGRQDITCDVAFDQLVVTHHPDRIRSQAEFLGAYGIEGLIAEGREIWQQRAHIGDLVAVRARSRVGEGEALLDPDGLGGFQVLEWQAG